MSRLCLASMIAFSLACSSSSSTIGTTMHFYANESHLFMAAQRAVTDLGGRIIVANESTGTLVGRFNVEGTPVDLNVGLADLPTSGTKARNADIDVTARATLVGDREPDEHWKEQLRWLEEEYLRVLSSSAPSPGSPSRY